MIITYHEIVEQPCPYVYAITTAAMSEHLAFLRRRRDAGLPPVPITFDDGLASHRHPAAALLEREGFRGMFFITPKLTGRSGFMGIGDLKQLVAAGHEVQSHGWSHALLSECGEEDLRAELSRSKEVLEDWLGREVDAIAIPGGAYDVRVLRTAAETGYRRVYISEPWFAPKLQEGVLVAGRLMLRRSTSAATLERLLATEGRAFSLPRAAHATRRAVRAVLGSSLYHYLWCRALGANHSNLNS